MTDMIERAKAALKSEHDEETQCDLLYDISPDLARALLREREAAEQLVDLIEGDLVGADWKRECYARVAAYRKAQKETDDDK